MPVISLAEDQFVLDNAVFGKISSPFTIAVSGVAAADVKSLLQNPLIGQLSVGDTAANIQHYWSDIESGFKFNSAGALTVVPDGVLSPWGYSWVQAGVSVSPFIKTIPSGVQTIAVGYDGKVGTYTTTGNEGYMLLITPKYAKE